MMEHRRNTVRKTTDAALIWGNLLPRCRGLFGAGSAGLLDAVGVTAAPP